VTQQRDHQSDRHSEVIGIAETLLYKLEIDAAHTEPHQ
jgi:hypothetical protein